MTSKLRNSFQSGNSSLPKDHPLLYNQDLLNSILLGFLASFLPSRIILHTIALSPWCHVMHSRSSVSLGPQLLSFSKQVTQYVCRNVEMSLKSKKISVSFLSGTNFQAHKLDPYCQYVLNL